MLDILFFSLFGIFVGFVAGILPGIHPNQVFVALIASLPLLSSLSTQSLISFVVSIAVSNTMFNYIPTIFFSVPDTSTVINVLPGHRMVLEGNGMNALFISLSSAFLMLLLAVSLLPALLFVIPIIHKSLYLYIHLLLIGLTGWMICLESDYRKRIFSLLLYILSGLWGLITLNSIIINSEWVLFPSLTGMFGIAGLLMSVKGIEKIPTQKSNNMQVNGIWKILITGLVAGLMIGVLPGAGESQAGVLVSQFTNLRQEEFLGSLAGINMSNLFFSIIALFSFGKIRSGTGAAISEIISNFTIEWLLFSVGVMIFSGALSVLLCWFIGKKMLKMLEKINYNLLSKIIIGFTVIMVFWLTGFVGVFVLFISTCLGLLAILLGVKRTSNMGYLMIPTIINFSGLSYMVNMLIF